MEKKILPATNWLKTAFLLVMLCLSGAYAQAVTTPTVDLDVLESGQTYSIDANTAVIARFTDIQLDGTLTLISSVDANTNLVPYTDDTYTDIIETVRDEEAKSKRFDVSRNQTVYFKNQISSVPYTVTVIYERKSNKEELLTSIDPAEGEVESLQNFQLTFAKKCYMARNSASLYKDDVLLGQASITKDGLINFDTEYTEAGEYTLVIPEDSYMIGTSQSGWNTEWKFKYTIAQKEIKMVVSLVGGDSPETAVTFDNLIFRVTFENGAPIYFNAWTCPQILGAIPNGQGGYFYTRFVDFVGEKISETEYKFTPNFGELAALEPGIAYMLKVPEDAFDYSWDPYVGSPEYTTWIKYEAPVFEPVTFSTTPAGGNSQETAVSLTLDEMKNIVLTIDGAETIDVSTEAAENGAIKLRSYNSEYEFWNDEIMLIPELVEGTTNQFRLISAWGDYQWQYLTAGVKQFQVPAGTFIIDGNEINVNSEWVTYYNLNLPDITITPEPETVLENGVQQIKLRFNYESVITLNSGYPLTISKDGVLLEEVDGYRYDNIVEFNAINNGTWTPYLEQGVYDIFVPAEAITLGSGKAFEGLSFSYTVPEPMMQFIPADGGTIASLDDLRIKFRDGETAVITANALDPEMYMVTINCNPYSGWNPVYAYPVAIDGEENMFKLALFEGQELVENLTAIEVTLNMGVFKYGESYSPFANVEFNIGEPGKTPTAVITPAKGDIVSVIDNDTFVISFENVTEVVLNETMAENADTSGACLMGTGDKSGVAVNYLKVEAIEGETNKFRLVEVEGQSNINYQAFPITAEGAYGLYIPYGLFTYDGQALSVYDEAYFEVQGGSVPVTYTAEPAEGNVNSLEYVALSFTPAVESVNPDATGSVIVLHDGEEVDNIPATEMVVTGWGAAPKVLSVSFSETFTAPGEYEVIIPAGVALLEGGSTNSEIVLNYTIVAPSTDWTAVADPAPGVVEKIVTVRVTFEGATTVSVPGDAAHFPYYATIAEDGQLTKVPFSIFPWLNNGVLELSINNAAEELTEPGRYAIIIPATYLVIDGVLLAEDIRFDYEIEGAQPEYEVVITPSDETSVNAEDLYTIKVTFEGAKSIELDSYMSATLYQLDNTGEPVANVYMTHSASGNVAEFKVMESHKPYLDNQGTFQFSIPVGMVTITDANDVVGKNKEEISATYNNEGAGVESIDLDAADLNIYSVAGMLIKRNANAEDYKALEPGVYIINGKKVFKK